MSFKLIKHVSFRSYSDDRQARATHTTVAEQFWQINVHNFIKARRQTRYMLSQATSSAHSPQTKPQLMLDFHCMFYFDGISILCLKMERHDNYDYYITDI